jgi:hypothetical protein
MRRFRNARLLVAAGSLLLMAPDALAQGDLFRSRGTLSTTDCEESNRQKVNEIAAERAQAEVAFQEQNVQCNAAGGDPKCFVNLRGKRRFTENGFDKRAIDAEAESAICTERKRLATASLDPCEQMYRQTLASADIENILAQADIKKNNITCNDGTGKSCRNNKPPTDLIKLGRIANADKKVCEKKVLEQFFSTDPSSSKTSTSPAKLVSRVKGSLSDNKNLSVTLDDFITYYSAIGDADHCAREVNGRYMQLRDKNGQIVRSFRYVQTPGHPEAIIDMRHFQFVGPCGTAVGDLVEAFQGSQGLASAYERQDFYSNDLGYQISVYHSQHSDLGYADQLRSFFAPSNGATIQKAIDSANHM